MTEQVRNEIEWQRVQAKAKAAILWDELQRLDEAAAPIVARVDKARSEWCAAYNKEKQLAEILKSARTEPATELAETV